MFIHNRSMVIVRAKESYAIRNKYARNLKRSSEVLVVKGFGVSLFGERGECRGKTTYYCNQGIWRVGAWERLSCASIKIEHYFSEYIIFACAPCREQIIFSVSFF